jgi:epoxyqueuosine reductase
MDSVKLSGLIKEKARALGFDKVGIAAAQKKPAHSNYLREWLDGGRHGEMRWFENHLEKRLDIKKLEPWAESVVIIAQNYYTPFKHSTAKDTVKISRYAWGGDYHKIIKKKLKILLTELKELDETLQGRIFCDSAPLQEKLWAVEAGIGWQGKNTNIISRDAGSWFFLGGLVLDKNLIYDEPVTDSCGKCTACIDACPTNALEAYKLDAARCLSYITIEYWDKPIPPDIAAKMDRWVFGCDICQDVCPWNRFAGETKESAFIPPPENVEPSIDELLALTEEAFKKRFKKTPVYRAKYENFIRNVKTVKSSG